MGGSASTTRKITIDNDNPTSVIKVTDECVQRIKGYQVPGVRQSTTDISSDATHLAPPFLYEPSLTSIQLRQDNLKALKENDEYWDKRIMLLKQNHDEIQNIMESEYQKAINDVAGNACAEDNLKQLTNVPCSSNRVKIIACYKKNINEPMKCAKEVQEFAECVDRSTLMIASK